MYGIFRQGFDSWITDAANLWFKTRKITPYETNKLRAGKNFVYNVMIVKASHNIQLLVRNTCDRVHSEYIVCKLPKKENEKKMNYFEIVCNR